MHSASDSDLKCTQLDAYELPWWLAGAFFPARGCMWQPAKPTCFLAHGRLYVVSAVRAGDAHRCVGPVVDAFGWRLQHGVAHRDDLSGGWRGDEGGDEGAAPGAIVGGSGRRKGRKSVAFQQTSALVQVAVVRERHLLQRRSLAQLLALLGRIHDCCPKSSSCAWNERPKPSYMTAQHALV